MKDLFKYYKKIVSDVVLTLYGKSPDYVGINLIEDLICVRYTELNSEIQHQWLIPIGEDFNFKYVMLMLTSSDQQAFLKI